MQKSLNNIFTFKEIWEIPYLSIKKKHYLKMEEEKCITHNFSAIATIASVQAVTKQLQSLARKCRLRRKWLQLQPLHKFTQAIKHPLNHKMYFHHCHHNNSSTKSSRLYKNELLYKNTFIFHVSILLRWRVYVFLLKSSCFPMHAHLKKRQGSILATQYHHISYIRIA